VKPTVEEVAGYCRERGNGIDAEAFVAFYESKGWRVGNSPMKDWKASVITWEKRSAKNGSSGKQGRETTREFAERMARLASSG
jgi:hypothetical protein